MGYRVVSSALLLIVCFFSVQCGPDGISPATMDQIRQAHVRMLTVDTHIDAALNLFKPGWNIGERHSSRKAGGSRVDLPRMKEGGLDAVFFVVSVHQGDLGSKGHANARETALRAIDQIKRMTEDHSRQIGLGLSPDDAYRLEKEEKLTAFIGLENGYAIGTDLLLIADYHAKGVRCLTLCGEADNAICDSATDPANPEDRGLSDFGRMVVAECNRVGMIIDVAHCSARSFSNVLALSRAPVIVSHSAARALCDHPENLTDMMIRALAETGGVIQISFDPRQLTQLKPPDRASVPDIVDHIDHVISLVGFGSVGIGSDLDGGGSVSGCRDVSEVLNITIELLRRGNSEQALEAIWGGNIMRVFKQVERIAKTSKGEKGA